MNTLAIDIGGTKFSIAAFDGDRMIRRKSDSTDREGGRDWMLARIVGIARDWQRELKFDSCGIGFGGPVAKGSEFSTRHTLAAGAISRCATSCNARSACPPSWITMPM